MPLSHAQRRESDGELEMRRLMVLVVSDDVLRQASADAQVDVKKRMSQVEVTGADGKTRRSVEVHVTSRLPLRCHSLAHLSDRLWDLGLKVSHATSETNDAVVSDSFHVTAPIAEGSTAAEAAEELQSKLRLMCATHMRPGSSTLALADDGSSRLGRLSPVNEAADPLIGLIDLGHLGTDLSLMRESEDARLWRNFLACHTPELLPPSVPAGEEAHAETEVGAIARVLAAVRHAEEQPGGGGEGSGEEEHVGSAWWDIICAFMLYKLRQEAGEAEVGMTLRELELGRKLGEGGYGVVRLARHRVSGALYAVKSIQKSRIRRLGEERTFELLERERKTLKLLACRSGHGPIPCLTRLICSGHDTEWLRLVLPAYLGGDLSLLLDAHGKALRDEPVQFYVACIVLALQHLHGLGIAFRDLKPENVLLDAAGWPTLTDFGLVSFVAEGEWSYSMVGTPEFMAPEVVAGAGHGTDADWWSLGVTMSELLTLNTPFREASGEHQALYANILHGRYTKNFRREHYGKIERRTVALVDGLLCVDPALRLGGLRRGVESLRVHPFFWGLSWEALEHKQVTPPDAALCADQARTKDFGGAELLAVKQAASFKSARRAPAPSLDAAAKALDRMFDFTDWGEQR